MIKGIKCLERDISSLGIPEAYIIDQQNERNYEIYEQAEIRLPENNVIDENRPSTVEYGSVIIIEL